MEGASPPPTPVSERVTAMGKCAQRIGAGGVTGGKVSVQCGGKRVDFGASLGH